MEGNLYRTDGNLVRTLKDNAMIKSALLLYKSEMLNIEKFIGGRFEFEKHANKIVKKKVLELNMPVQLQETLVVIATRIFCEIRNRNLVFNAMHKKICKIFERECHCLDGILETFYCYNSNGFADDQKIHETLMKNEKIDLVFRFTVACEFDHIKYMTRIWDEMTPAMKNRLNGRDIPIFLRFWTLMSFKREDVFFRNGLDLPLFVLFRLLQQFLRDGRFPFFDGFEDDIKGWIRIFFSRFYPTDMVELLP